MIHQIRGLVMPILTTLLIACVAVGWGMDVFAARIAAAPMGAIVLLGVHDLVQRKHSILRNFPVLGHLRFLLEDVGPELRQYVVEHNTEGRPFNRDQRSLVYQRSKGLLDKKPFGTELDVYLPGHHWLTHSLETRPPLEDPARKLRIDVGGPDCSQPYSSSFFNISAMSFGSLSASAIQALNEGARRGGFAHNTGEGGISRYHEKPGGDLIWQVGTGYFGCRRSDGGFDPERFREAAASEHVRMIELKLSQGAKPGHGGILPGEKVTPEIAEARRIEIGTDCISPASHQAFDGPTGLLEFVSELRSLAGGKPVGFKLAIGRPVEFLSICRAIHETGLAPDFVSVDGGEGGTGAAPIEFSDHMGMPLLEAIVLVNNALIGIGVRERIRVFASGKRITSIALAHAAALGADAVNSARGFMLALGCIQAQRCHTNRCPVGVATQDPRLAHALHVENKAERVERFHASTLKALAEVVAAAGLSHPSELSPEDIYQRVSPWEIRPLSALYPTLSPGALIDSTAHGFLREAWNASSASSFR
ncbi:MAG: FMN-binding glutamate synthase family protein [Deltaproteobacteria bacterium]|nr:FMN-binding glutamate synthase family protein [Deltaproteobacteria bacterium]